MPGDDVYSAGNHEKPLVALCHRLLAQLPDVAPGIAAAIRDQIREYTVVPLQDHIRHVEEQQGRIVQALLERRQPDEADLRRAAALGRLRAAQGLSFEAVIGAYHVGNRELWKLLNATATTERDMLPELATLMWENIGLISTTIAAAHFSVVRAQHTHTLMLRLRLFDLLAVGVVDEELDEVARALGFDYDGPFVGLRTGPVSTVDVESRTQKLRTGVGVVVAASNGAHQVVVLLQRADPVLMVDQLRRQFPGVGVGVGLERTGLHGAVGTMRDARLCAELGTVEDPVRYFADSWWEAVLAGERDRLKPLVASRHDIIAANPHLLEAVLAYARSGFSVSACAGGLNMHPNSVAYRLQRWHALTGWDPRSFDGLMTSILAAVTLDLLPGALPEHTDAAQILDPPNRLAPSRIDSRVRHRP